MSVKSEARDSQLEVLKSYAKSCSDSSSELSYLLSSSDGSSSDLLKIRNRLKGLISEAKSNRGALKSVDSTLSDLNMKFTIAKTESHENALFEEIRDYRQNVVTALKGRVDGYEDSASFSEWSKSRLGGDISDDFNNAIIVVYGVKNGVPVAYKEVLAAMDSAGMISYELAEKSNEDAAEAATDSAVSTSADDTVYDESAEEDDDSGDFAEVTVDAAKTAAGWAGEIICYLLTSGAWYCGPIGSIIDKIVEETKPKDSNPCKGKAGRCRCACYETYACGGAGIMMDEDETCWEELELCLDQCDNEEG
tara:strand:- start:4185 stop:5105 length:921 start_codon:yes stop_codon:yes gene_type:complete